MQALTPHGKAKDKRLRDGGLADSGAAPTTPAITP